MKLTDNIEIVSDIDLEVLSAGPFGPGSERVRGRAMGGAYLVTIGRVSADLNVSLGSDFKYDVCDHLVEIHMVGTIWSLIVAERGRTGGWVVVTVEDVEFANSEELEDGSTGLSLGLELLLGLRMGSDRWAPLDCEAETAFAELRRHGLLS